MKFKVGLIFMLSVSVISGCSLIEQFSGGKVDKLQKQAEIYYEKGDLEEAIKTYKSIEKINSSEKTQDKILELKREKNAYNIVQDFHDKLYQMTKNELRQDYNSTNLDLKFIYKDLANGMNKIESIEVPAYTKVGSYIEVLKNTPSFKSLQIDMDNPNLSDENDMNELEDGYQAIINSIDQKYISLKKEGLNNDVEGLLEIDLPNYIN